MNTKQNPLIDQWMSLTNIQNKINCRVESALQEKYNLSLKEFYVLYLVSLTDEKKLRIQQLQEMVGLSQSAMSRLIARLEAKNCGVLNRHVCDADRRGVYTCITEKGELKLKETISLVQETLNESLSELALTNELNSLFKSIK